MDLAERWRNQLDKLRGQHRLRMLQIGQGVDFSSNDYLGYAKLPTSPLMDYSHSGAASRLLRGHHAIWDDVESVLASWHGAEAALVMTSGYVANQGLLSTIVEPDDWVASDACNHASIIDGLRLTRAKRHIYPHADLAELEKAIQAAPKQGARFIVTESLFSMEGDVPPLAALIELAERHGAHVIVDEAHATGCFGSRGGGLVDALDLRSRVLATVHTGGKALGVPGAYICCSTLLKQLLVNRCRHFIFTTALPPLIGAWWLGAIERAQEDDKARQRLHNNTRLFREELHSREVRTLGEHYIVPVLLGDDNRTVRAASQLQVAGFD